MDLKKATILVTATSYGKTDSRLKTDLEAHVGSVIYNPLGRPLSSAELAELLVGVDGLIAGLDAIDQEAISKADRLKVIARYGVGVDNVDLNAAKNRGIIVTNTPGANAGSVAELALGLMLVLARQILEGSRSVQQGNWPRLPGKTLEGKTVGILGLGAIGKQFARRLAGFDCTILAYDPLGDQSFANEHNVRLIALDEVVTQSDFLSLHIPLTPETRGLVNSSFIAKMKKGAILINTSRGEVVDELALAEAIMNGHLGGAGLDAFMVEPPDPSNPLLKLPQVVATPHLGAQTDGATSKMGWWAMQDCLAVLRGQEPRFRVI